MTYRHLITLAGMVALWCGIWSCQPNEAGSPEPAPEPTTPGFKPTPMAWKKPANFPEPVYDLAKNPVTVQGFALGRALFYDGLLSHDGTVSCGFCHQPSAAFAHTDHALSHGIRDQIGTRNVPAIQNVAWQREFFWDGGVQDLDLLPISPIQNPVEMGDTLANVLAKLRKDPQYPGLFEAAFGTKEINTERMMKALSQFMVMLVSANSRYDKAVRGEGPALTDTETRGLTVFKAKCASCHATDLFTDGSFRNNGLPRIPTAKVDDIGRGAISLNPDDRYKFRVPSLRNVERTPPYMHDGRFWTLEQVLTHYAGGITDSPTLDPALKAGFTLSRQEQTDLIAFLRTLTDTEFLSDRRFIAN
ncbi:c-type cytochrome [Rudanella paleaurantiibacter]|uniref:C-type cytochrome n=1 Tax=Rudanella paleaurantiibacter TaxID=2614655 RepID=A0A7J5U1D1_9BACT|nr:cytochrome c peroxidase [Rudanella paleaurantiibacter]KAB7731455.1 c-type cytochrome [Rudanella paleaurantiibacter]